MAQPVTLRGRPAEAYEPSTSAPDTLSESFRAQEQGVAHLRETSPEGNTLGTSVPTSVIGVICAGDLATHRDEVKAAISRGLAESPDAVWVCIEPRSDRMTHDVMISLDLEPVVLPMNPAWQRKALAEGVAKSDDDNAKADSATPMTPSASTYDLRRLWRDLEMLQLCDQLIVFHRRAGNSPWRDRVKSGLYDQRLFVIDIGPVEKPKRSNSRKPVGA